MGHLGIGHERLRWAIAGGGSFLALLLALGLLTAGQLEGASADETSSGESGEKGEESGMTIQLIEDIIREAATKIEGDEGAWQFVYSGTRMMCIADLNFDRMRIIAPIIDQTDMTEEQMLSVLDANFHTALDARYATNEGILYSAFIHPLSALQNDQLRSALDQVANLVSTFGSTYQSTELTFGQ